MSEVEPDPNGRTIGEAKREVDRIEARIETLETIGADTDHIERLREKRDRLRDDVEYSQDHYRKQRTAENAIRAMANNSSE